MRFMMMIMADENSEAGLPPDPRLMEAVGKYTEEMMKAGVVLLTGGLGPSAMGTRILASGGKLTQVDGPFAEAKELIGGFAVVQAKSKEEAIEWGRRFMKIHVDILGPSWVGKSEIRPLFGPEDFAPGQP
jgi:hypothetical protein